MQKGIQNEFDFANFLDNKRIKHLPYNFQNMIRALYKNVNDNTKIECWKSNYKYEKADIKIKVNGEVKGISIKTGRYSSIHQEKLNSFYTFLSRIGVDNYIIKEIDNFMIGKVKEKRVDAKTYIENNKESIKNIRDSLNEYYVKTNLIIRFLFQGTEIQKYDCDVIIHGTPRHFLWATKNEILKYLVEYPNKKENYLNFSALNIKCYDRNLRENPNKVKKQEEIQVKWYTIEQDIKTIMENRKTSYNKQ